MTPGEKALCLVVAALLLALVWRHRDDVFLQPFEYPIPAPIAELDLSGYTELSHVAPDGEEIIFPLADGWDFASILRTIDEIEAR